LLDFTHGQTKIKSTEAKAFRDVLVFDEQFKFFDEFSETKMEVPRPPFLMYVNKFAVYAIA